MRLIHHRPATTAARKKKSDRTQSLPVPRDGYRPAVRSARLWRLGDALYWSRTGKQSLGPVWRRAPYITRLASLESSGTRGSPAQVLDGPDFVGQYTVHRTGFCLVPSAT